jgi:hypothetical protein
VALQVQQVEASQRFVEVARVVSHPCAADKVL